MWIVIKCKKNSINLAKNSIQKNLDTKTIFFSPKFKCNKFIKYGLKFFEKPLIDNYLFCFNEKFSQNKILNSMLYLRGLEYVLQGHIENQPDILKFINHCKKCENKDGYLTQEIFKIKDNKELKFISGPFADLVFKILSKDKNGLNILVGNIKTSISKKSNYLYNPA